MMRILLCLAALVSVLAAPASAATISFTDSIPLSTTNWSDSVTVSKFNPALGTLTKVTWELSGYVEGSAKFESLDASPTTVTMDLAADIELQRPDLSTIVITNPLANTSDDVTAYDDNLDFGGTSGKTYSALSSNDMDSATSTAPADLTLFTGLGSITMPVEATGASTGSGAGNLILQFSTFASSSMEVFYEYTQIPEPSTFALVGMLAFGLVAFGRRRL